MAHESLECELIGKCEYFNPSGSTKDRIVMEMIKQAEKRELISTSKGSTLIEPTSGNTGISIGLIGSLFGYDVVCTMKHKSSLEKVLLMNYLGVTLIRTPTNVPPESPRNHINTAFALAKKKEKQAIVLNQYANPDNPKSHSEQTAMEIWHQCDGRIDVLFVGVGTGGSVTGMGRQLKQLNPAIKIIAVEPNGSLFAEKPVNSSKVKRDGELQERTYWVEGIGFDYVPEVLNTSVVDEWISVSDKDSFQMAKKLATLEGVLGGGSSGTITQAAVEWCKRNKFGSDKRAVVMFPDTIRNYFTKFIDPYWMVRHGFDEIPKDFHSKARAVSLSEIPHKKIPSLGKASDSVEEIRQAFFNFPVVHLKGSERDFIEQNVYFKNLHCREGSLEFDEFAVDIAELEEVFHLTGHCITTMEYLFEKYQYGILLFENEFWLYERNSFYQCIYS